VGAQLGDHHSTPLSDHAPPSIKQRVTDASTPAERHNRPPHQGVRTSRKNTLLIDWRTPWCPSRPYRSHDKELDHRFSSVCANIGSVSLQYLHSEHSQHKGPRLVPLNSRAEKALKGRTWSSSSGQQATPR